MAEIVKVDVKRVKPSLALEVRLPQIPTDWDYDKSVKKVRGFIYKWANLTTEMVEELYVARVKLSAQGKRTDLTSGQLSRSWTTYCKEIDHSRRVVNRWIDFWLSSGSLVGKLTGNMENYTPMGEIEMVRDVLGEIDLDPASCKLAQKIIQATKYFTAKDNGLSKPWRGRVFLNPPYCMPLIRDFTDKLIEELPHIDAAILLTNDQTDTAWWQKCARESDSICMPSGRISFYNVKGSTSPTNGQTYFYYGDKQKRFRKVFSEKGLIVKVIQ